MQVGDIVRTRKGNVAIVLTTSITIASEAFVDLLFLKTQYVRTGFPAHHCEVLSESR